MYLIQEHIKYLYGKSYCLKHKIKHNCLFLIDEKQLILEDGPRKKSTRSLNYILGDGVIVSQSFSSPPSGQSS